jgi:hypothetical protein
MREDAITSNININIKTNFYIDKGFGDKPPPSHNLLTMYVNHNTQMREVSLISFYE